MDPEKRSWAALYAAIERTEAKLFEEGERRDVRRQRHTPPPVPNCSILFFIVTRTELASLKYAADELGLSFDVCYGRYGEYYDLGTIGDERVLAVRTKMGPLLEKGSAARALQYRVATGAGTIIGVGMAFGVDRSRQRLGDVLISTGLLPYDMRKVVSRDDGTPRADYSSGDRYSSHKGLRSRFDRFAQRPFWRHRVHQGLFLSGGARIHCTAFRDELVRECGAGRGELVVGGDMEGVGFLSASTRASPCWIIVKGISDFADDARDTEVETWRTVACYRAARFVLEALRVEEN